MVDLKINLRGYHISEELYNGSRTIVYRGYRETDKLPLVIKILKNSYPSFGELVQFRNQYTITKNLNSPLIIQTYSLENHENGYALVMEDFGGISLQEWSIKKGKKLHLTDFLEVAITLGKTLDILYQERIIHKDIKPSNILINPETKQVKLIDFSIASLLPQETQILINPNVLEGTLAYISPEQTGRMNRGIDYRTDFYSLGVTFYELLTGQLPFSSKEPMELIHCHLAKTPPLVNQIDSQIPNILSKIINKLMAKNAEDRYQSSWGLKYDLENCLSQLQQTGKISDWEIGERDVSDRFIIPDKLYGRETEVQTLLQAFERVSNPSNDPPHTPHPTKSEATSGFPLDKGDGRGIKQGAEESPPTPLSKGGGSEMMLVAGFSGIGKTAVVNEVHKPIVRQRGYFIKGKFDQFQRNIPFSAFVQAFRNLIEQLLTESDAKILQWKNKILEALGENGQVISEVIPELENIIGRQPPAPELSGTAAQNRFNLLFQKFTKVFTSIEHPLVIFLDDLQWADLASLNLIKLLIAESQYLLLIGAYRDNEVNQAHPLILTLNEIDKTPAIINTITLAPLSQIQINKLVADTLKCTEELGLPLTQLVFQKTQGNPFFATQFLKALHQEKLIKFDLKLGIWECDIAQIIQQAVTDDVVEFMALQLEKLPLFTQNILKLAACIGNQFDLKTLGMVSQKSEIETATDLWKALQEGLILPNSQIYKFYLGEETQAVTPENNQTVTYKFLHDRVQQAAYSLIPDEQKQTTHYQIGKLLLQQISSQAREERIFEIVNQLNYGTALITQQTERDELAKLNLIACRKARSATAYQAGQEYATIGLSMLGKNGWQRQYDMNLEFHNAAAELAALCGDFEKMEKLVEKVIARAHTLLEKINVYRTRIFSNVSQNKLAEAINIAQQLLQQLGITFADPPTENDIQQEIAEIRQLIGNREIEDLVNLPPMTDEEKIAIVQIANSIIPATYITGSPLLPLVVTLSVKLSIKYGNTLASVFAYACYSMIACNLLQDVDTGVKFGLLALQVTSELGANAVKPEAFSTATLFSLHRQYPVKETLQLSQESYTSALEVGNLDFAGRSAYTYCINAFGCGQPLIPLEQETRVYCNGLVQLKQLTTANYCRIYWQSILNLLQTVEHPGIFSGEALQEAELLPQLIEANDFFGLYFFYLYKLMLCYLFEEIESAQHHAVEVKRYFVGGVGTFGEPMFYFYDSLTVLATLSSDSEEVAKVLEQVEQNQTQLQQQWANYAPMNHQHKVDLVAAEKCRVLGDKAKALELYEQAISGAKANEYIQEEALANELAAKFYLDWGKEKVAAGYLQEAYYCYARWGAKAKTDELEKRYPQLLQPILQQQQLNLNTTETLVFPGASSATQTSSKSISDIFDFTSVLQAARSISSSLELNQLITSLTQIILTNSGANKAVLIFPQENTWQIQAISLLTQGEIQTTFPQELLDNCQNIPLNIVHYVKNTQKTIVINNCHTDIPGMVGEYLLKERPQSLLCTPIVNQGNLVGIIYLENKLTSRVFTRDRLLVLNFLCSQAAISLENAQLYNHLWEREKFLSSIYEGVGCLIFVVDVRDHHTFEYTGWSKSCEIAIGIPAAEVIGKTPQELFVSGEAEIMYQNYLHCWQTQTSLTYEECLTLNNQKTWWLTTLNPLKDETGKVDRILGTTINISDRKQAEEEVKEKSQALATALEDLKQAQLQIVQNEKMSALGNLVAGVAHEMNNPLGFISATLDLTKPNIADIIEHLQLYQESFPNKTDKILEHLEETDLEYTLEDLPKMIDSMKMACDRLKNISTSLRTFSRGDKDYKVPFNIHEGIDSTILILKHRLKANEKRPAIEVITSYGNLPKIDCFPGQLNQVFMNIIANAIDALDESNMGRNFQEIQNNPNRIIITTLLENDKVKIKIADNGKGIKEPVKEKIFDHLFTTKSVGKGTGLGLAIAKSIVVEKHSGKIQVNSRLGAGTEFIITLPTTVKIKN